MAQTTGADGSGITTTEPELDDVAKALKLEQVKAETRKAIALAEADTRKAETTEPASKLLAGTTKLGDKAGASIAAVVAADQLKKVAGALAGAIGPKAAGRVLVVDDRSIAEGDVIRAEVTSRLDLFEVVFSTLSEWLDLPAVTSTTSQQQTQQVTSGTGQPQGAVQVAPTIAPAATGLATLSNLGLLAADVVGLFRADYEIQGRDLTVSRLALVAEVVNKMQRQDLEVFVPGMRPVNQSIVFAKLKALLEKRFVFEHRILEAPYGDVEPRNKSIDALLAHIADLRGARAKADDGMKRTRIEEMIASSQTELTTLRTDDFTRDRAKVAAARGVLTAFDAYVAAVTAIPQGAKYSAIVSAALREQVNVINPGQILFLEVGASGGDVVTKTSLWPWANYVAYFGAVEATFILASMDGKIAASGTATSMGRRHYTL